MFQKIIILLLSTLLFACASQQEKSANPSIMIDQQMMAKNPEDLSFWMVFALGRISCSENYPVSTFGEFACAFKMAAVVNSDNKNTEKNPAQDKKPQTKLMKALGKVVQSGFMNEYMFYNYQQSNWFLEPGLKTKAYQEWMKENLKDHTPSSIGATIKNAENVVDESSIEEIKLTDGMIQSVGSLQYQGKHKYEKASLGFSVRYRISSNVNGWVDFYIYPKTRLSTNRLNRNGLVDEATVAKSGMMYHAQKTGAKKIEVLEESSDAEIHFLKGRYEINREGTLYIDELFMSDNEKYFLKARSSYLKGQRDYQDHEIKIIFESLLSNVK